MATDAELRAAGIHLPTGSDYISEGDDAISANARVTWDRIDTLPQYRGNLDEQPGTLATLLDGVYKVRYLSTAETWGLPQMLIGALNVSTADGQRIITFRPNDAGAGWGVKSEWVLATDSGGTLRDRWQRIDKGIMRTAPVVLTAPAGEYVQAQTRGAHRLPFTVPTNVSRVRVHMRPWNFRTRQEWGPAVLEGAMIAAQATDDSGTVTGTQWEVPGAAGRTVPGTGWTSDWFHANLTMDDTFLLSYGATWQDTERGLVLGQCWSHEDATEYTSTETVSYQNGWGQFALQPMDIWIECEAPSTVPVWGYFGASNTMGMSASPSVFGSYPQLHARKNRAFCALTAAGGWSIMDDTLHDQEIVRRFGYPARMLDRLYLDLGSNIAARDATLTDAQAELERWMNVNRNSFGSPDVYLATQIARDDITETSDLAGTLSAWNEWIRYELAARDEVRGVIDFAAIFADPARPWTARKELRASPTDVHFGTVGQRMRAQACDGEIQLPTSAQRTAEPDPGPYDSGLRNVKSLIVSTNGWDTARSTLTAVLERQGPNVNLSFTNLQNVASPLPTDWVEVLSLPIGFRPSSDQYDRDFSGGRTRVLANGKVQVQNPSSTLNYFGFNFMTRNTPPTTGSEPGSPA